MRIFKCPCCNGEGGYTDVILEDGSGPYYPCNFCDDIGKVGLIEKLVYTWYKIRGEV